MKKFVPITGLILSIAIGSVSAATDITKNNFNVSTGVLTVGGVTDIKNGMVTLNIPKLGITGSQIQTMGDIDAANNLLYCEQKIAGEDGAFEFTVTIPDGASEGIYNIYLGGESEDTARETTFYNIDVDSYSSLISSLNAASASGQEAFDAVYGPNEQALFNYSDITTDDNDVIRKILCDYAKNVGLSQTDSILNMSVYKSALAAQLFHEGRVQEAESLFDSMYVMDSSTIKKYSVIEDYRRLVNTNEKRAYFSSVFGACSTIAQFEKAVTDGMILTAVRYPENVTDLKRIFEKYTSYTGANTTKAELSDYSSISGKQFTTLSACVSAFNASVGKNQGAGGGGGASGGGSGSSSGSVSTGTESEFGVAPPGGGSYVGTLDIKFEDLNSVQWAYTAISELYERKIISGKSETRFAPNDKVKREEYAKMMVEMAGLDIDNSTNAFSDISNNAWYKGYVNTAYKNGFCSGIGNGIFGAGMEISRQDMCVIAYNVIKKLGHEIPSGELAFDDAADFGEYAKGPVAALNKAGIVNGVGNNRFNPKGSATRAEAAVIIYKLLNYIE